MADIFLSYKREDRAIADRISDALKQEGYTIWMDVGIRGGTRWDQEIETELESARAVIVIWTPRSVSPTSTVRDEALWARQNGKFVSVLAEDCSLPVMYRGIQYNDLTTWDQSTSHPNWKGLLENIARVFAGESVETSVSDPVIRPAPGDLFSATIKGNFRPLPPPKRGETWQLAKTLKSETETFKPLRALIGGHFLPHPYKIQKAFWAGNKLYALGRSIEEASVEQVIMRGSEESAALGNIVPRSGPIIHSKTAPSMALINTIAPASPDKDWLLITDYRRATFWIPNTPWGSDTHDAIYAEIGSEKEGTWQTNKTGHWPDFSASPNLHEFGDNYHSNAHILKLSPDGKLLLHWRGFFTGTQNTDVDWALDVWRLTNPSRPSEGRLEKIGTAQIGQLGFKVSDVETSPTSRFALLKVDAGVIVDLKDFSHCILPSLSSNDFERIFKKPAWHSQQSSWAEVQAKRIDNTWVFRVSILNLETNEYSAHHDLSHTQDPHEIAWSPNGQFIATGSHDETIEIWDLKTDKVQRLFTKFRPHDLTFSPDGQRLLVCDAFERASVSVIDPKTGDELTRVHSEEIVGWKNDSSRFATLNKSNTQIEIFELNA